MASLNLTIVLLLKSSDSEQKVSAPTCSFRAVVMNNFPTSTQDMKIVFSLEEIFYLDVR